MPLSITNKPQFTGVLVLFIGVALLIFTFINAFLFLQEPFSILAAGDLTRVFGEALAPLIQACVRLMYLGIMGWIGSLLTVRGIPLVMYKHVPVPTPTPVTQIQPQPQPKPATQPASATTPTPQPQPTPQKPNAAPSPQPATPQAKIPPPEPKQEEPKAILITPENQKEE